MTDARLTADRLINSAQLYAQRIRSDIFGYAILILHNLLKVVFCVRKEGCKCTEKISLSKKNSYVSRKNPYISKVLSVQKLFILL